MNIQRKECGGEREYMGLTHPIKFCQFYNKWRMKCGAKEGSCGKQYVDPGSRIAAVEVSDAGHHQDIKSDL